MISDKTGAVHLAAILKAKGLQHIVLCPGSRNAPLIDIFTSDPFFKCYSIVDERSAGFFAIGIAQVIQDTVAVCCTSGSALLNLAPAVAEAFYQRAGLLVISADRPVEWVNQGESQTLNQHEVFRNYIRGSYTLVQEPLYQDDIWFHDRQISEAVNKTREKSPGPVHINIPFREPLYEKTKLRPAQPKIIDEHDIKTSLSEETVAHLLKQWQKFNKVMLICGQQPPNDELQNMLADLSKKGVVVLTESTSNLHDEAFFDCIDKIIIPSPDTKKEALQPDLLITIGGPLISRKIKNYLREYRPKCHWHVDLTEPYLDAYQSLTDVFQVQPVNLLSHLVQQTAKNTTYRNIWLDIREKSEEKHATYLNKAIFSDLKVFEILHEELPDGALLQVGNSAAIRYAQLFRNKKKFTSYSNRGTSGIEGALSTAAGASAVSKQDVYHITGDLSLMYDSNGLWNNYISPKLKIILINNGGGGIFRIIDGPSRIEHFEKFIETKQDISFDKLAALFNLDYLSVNDTQSLRAGMTKLKANKQRACLLEIKTPREENSKVLFNYFEHLKQNA